MIFCVIVTSWSIFSYKMVETVSMIKFSIYLLTPTIIAIEIHEGFRYYKAAYVDAVPYNSIGDNFLQKNSSAMLMIFSFVYFTSSAIKIKKINLRNKIAIRLRDFSLKIMENQASSRSFNKLRTMIYETFFKYFQYVMLFMTIATSMIEVNLLNFCLILFCIGVTTRHKDVSSNLWVYYVFFIDLCILIKYFFVTQGHAGEHTADRHTEQHRGDFRAGGLHGSDLEER